MVTILASSPTRELNETYPYPMLNESNGFVERLGQVWPAAARCLMIAAEPDAWNMNDEMTGYYRAATENVGLAVACFDLWDSRNSGLTKEAFDGYDVIFLAGGHVPTERAWFEYIQLRWLLQGYDGIVIGTSAGSMNMAQEVYAWPERPGESLDPEYTLFFEGLGLAKTQVLPHYQKVKDIGIDGKLYVQDIARGHSYGKRFFAIPDGSYVWVCGGVETVYGAALLVSDGEITEYCQDNTWRVSWPAEN
jgi:dipeptidase E